LSEAVHCELFYLAFFTYAVGLYSSFFLDEEEEEENGILLDAGCYLERTVYIII
jgi:hypothetical protein